MISLTISYQGLGGQLLVPFTACEAQVLRSTHLVRRLKKALISRRGIGHSRTPDRCDFTAFELPGQALVDPWNLCAGIPGQTPRGLKAGCLRGYRDSLSDVQPGFLVINLYPTGTQQSLDMCVESKHFGLGLERPLNQRFCGRGFARAVVGSAFVR